MSIRPMVQTGAAWVAVGVMVANSSILFDSPAAKDKWLDYSQDLAGSVALIAAAILATLPNPGNVGKQIEEAFEDSKCGELVVVGEASSASDQRPLLGGAASPFEGADRDAPLHTKTKTSLRWYTVIVGSVGALATLGVMTTLFLDDHREITRIALSLIGCCGILLSAGAKWYGDFQMDKAFKKLSAKLDGEKDAFAAKRFIGIGQDIQEMFTYRKNPSPELYELSRELQLLDKLWRVTEYKALVVHPARPSSIASASTK